MFINPFNKNLNFSKYFFLGIFASLSFTACQQKNKVDNKSTQASSSTYQFSPKPAPTAVEQTQLLYGIQNWYDSFISRSNVNGAVLVAKNGHIIFEKYKGFNPLRSKDSIDAHTPFHIASVSKTFTAMTVLKLQEEGKLNIEDPFKKYFPEFNYEGITIKNLLSHRSGLPNYLYFMEKLCTDKSKFISNRDILDTLIANRNTLENIGTPDRKFSYCNTNYALLALLIEKITGQTYPEYIKQTIFAPLQMDDSFVYTPADSFRITPNYDFRGTEIPLNFLDNVYGDKNIYATVRDLFKWDQLLSSNKFLNASSLALAYTPYSNERPGIKNYGLGWRMDNFPNGKKMIFHNGWWHGNNASFIRLMDEDACIIVLNNQYSNAVYKSKYLVNIFNNYFDAPKSGQEENISE